MNKIHKIKLFCFQILIFFPLAFAQGQDNLDAKKLLNISKQDMVLGDINAKNTVIEYISPSCFHCADFHIKTFPEIKKHQIDTGKVKWVTRFLVGDAPSLSVAKLTKCKSDAKVFYKLLDLFLSNQSSWALSPDPIKAIQNIFLLTGNTKEHFEHCINNKTLENEIIDDRKDASSILKIHGTPTFYVNGKEEKIISVSTLESIIKKSLR